MNIINRFIKFLREVQEEIKLVTWPARPELIGSAIVVFMGVVILAGYISIVDYVLSTAARALLR